MTKIELPGTAITDLPNTLFTVYKAGPDLYVASPRVGSTVTLVCKGKEIEVEVQSPVQIGPLATFGMPVGAAYQHYGSRGGTDPIAMYDAIERDNPVEKAMDPRTVYTVIGLSLPGAVQALPGSLRPTV